MRKLKNSELNRLSIEEFKSISKLPIVIVLDNIRSMNNIGSAFRTADAFCVESIYLCGITATPPHREIQKTALGATDSVNWKYFNSTSEAVQQLRIEGYTLFSIEQAEGSIPLPQFVPNHKKIAYIFGNEINGVDELVMNMVDGCIEIPQYGTKHSLNVSVSIGIVIWDHLLKQQPLNY
ncbi:MAG TPA: RNA methyltransferase [Bacteroidales bacterium]|nr:RNA methyltransferase [Bacteroidales bacterium]HPT04263.1 RNA methyltransferase [Bacteroidales bacterium]